MKGTSRPRIKICCISSVAEALTAVDCGASALGLVGHMPSGPGVIPDALIAQIVQSTPPSIGSFLLTSETNAQQIIQHQQRVHTNTIQIVDELKEGTYWEIKQALPSVKIVQVIHVVGEKSVEEAIKYSEYVDAILLDSGNPNLQIKELGGTGRVHDWQLSKKIRESINKPLFLAGGLKMENVRQAVEQVQPFGLDLCSSVRTQGKLDTFKLEKFFEEVNRI